MLESTVSFLPSDWFSLSGWPPFQLTYCKCAFVISLISLRIFTLRKILIFRHCNKVIDFSIDCDV